VIVGSLDGKVYGIDSNTGSLKWSYQTGAGVSAPPVITNGIAYIGSRDGKMYALTTSTGTLKWMYQTRVHPIDPNSPFNAAPIFTPAAVSADGTTVLFGAENMFFYALNTTDGTEKWTPKKLVGQSFLFGWPVVAGDKVIVRTMSSLPGAEFVMEDVLDGLPANPTMSEERTAILNWLNTNPHQKSMYVFDIATGNEPYQVGMGRVTGNNYAAHPPVLDNQGRLLTYWRSKVPTFIQNTACYGTKYCPDISAMNLATGERVPLTNNSGNKLAPELDNGFQPTVGGTYLYLANHFRGTHAINMSDGTLTRLTTQSAKWDCGDFRGWGFKVIYYGNDSEPSCTSTNAAPGSAYSNTGGYAGIAIATTSGRSLLYINEGDVGFIVAIEKQ
jgi:outer membrane protein assembly factor BamB